MFMLKTKIHAEDEEAFRYACNNGHLEVAKWIVDITKKILDTKSRYMITLEIVDNRYIYQ